LHSRKGFWTKRQLFEKADGGYLKIKESGAEQDINRSIDWCPIDRSIGGFVQGDLYASLAILRQKTDVNYGFFRATWKMNMVA
jgi:hypothetical protein